MDASRADRTCRFELLEPRQLLAANPLPGFSLGNVFDLAGDTLDGQPSSIRGSVYLCGAPGCQTVTTELGLAEVSICLLDEIGETVRETVTDADGFFEFVGLTPGIYAVQETQPSEHAEGQAYVGSGGGIALDSNLIGEIVVSAGSQLVDYRFSDRPLDDVDSQIDGDKSAALHGIDDPNGREQESDFALSDVVVSLQNATRNISDLTQQTRVTKAPSETVAMLSSSVLFVTTPSFGGSSQRIGYVWHLSMVDGGGQMANLTPNGRLRLTNTSYDVSLWQTLPFDFGSWATSVESGPVGDNWDGHDETDVFFEGDWHLDINDKGLWDEADLWIHLGFDGGMPAAGDWDANEKADIGVFIPIRPKASDESPVDSSRVDSPQAQTTDSATRTKRATHRHLHAEVVDQVFRYDVQGESDDHLDAGDDEPAVNSPNSTQPRVANRRAS